MNKKGFTLVELLGVLVFMGILMLVVFPNATGLLRQAKENRQKSFLNDVYLATEAYVQKYIDDEEFQILKSQNNVGKTKSITFADLIQDHFLKSTVVEPKSGKKISELSTCEIVITRLADNKFSYELTSC